MTDEIKLAALAPLLDAVMAEYPDWEATENPVVFVLAALKITLERRIAMRTPTVEWTHVMRTAVAEANILLDRIYQHQFQHVENWNPALEDPTNPQQRLAAILMATQHELLADVGTADDYLRDELKMTPEDYAAKLIEAFEREGLDMMEKEFEQATD